MIIKNSYLLNFRSFDNLSIQFGDRTNIIVGNNAEGKTNILEAVYFSAKGRSFRPSKESDLIKLDKEHAYIRVDIDSEGISEIIEVKLSRDKKKQIRINEDLIDTMKELRTFFDIVTFTPEDLKIIKDNKSFRRNFIDELIISLVPSYSKILVKYNNILDQRNYLLKYGKNKKYFVEQVKAATKQLTVEGSTIIKMRYKYISLLNKVSKQIHEEITSNREIINLEYDNSTIKSGIENIEKNLYSSIMENIEKDKEMGFTTVGCHRDDIVINIDTKNSRVYASQGQQRTLVISLKLAQIKIYEKLKETKPIVLLDDVFSELDDSRIIYLLDEIRDYQSIITSTNIDFINGIENLDYRLFKLNNKNIKILR